MCLQSTGLSSGNYTLTTQPSLQTKIHRLHHLDTSLSHIIYMYVPTVNLAHHEARTLVVDSPVKVFITRLGLLQHIVLINWQILS